MSSPPPAKKLRSGKELEEDLTKAEAEIAQLRTLLASGNAGPAGATVLLIGSGGREHALAKKLAESPKVGRVLVAPGNGGTESEGGKVSNLSGAEALDVDDHAAVARKAKALGAALVVVGPEDPLAKGLGDVLSAAGVPCFGPSKAAAQLEASKAFSKAFMARHDLPTARFGAFTAFGAAQAFVEAADFRVVVKCSGLAAGKGVLLPETREETIQALKEVMVDRKFGSAGDEVVLEEFMEGQEVSLLAFTDGKTAVGMPGAQDHKRVLDQDQGPNTGGMGAYAPAPILTPGIRRAAMQVVQKTVDAMAAEGMPYKGVLYAGLMLTPPREDGTQPLPYKGVRLVEFNCRFGDPETQVVLPLLKSDLFDVMVSCVAGTLGQTAPVEWHQGFAATVVAAAPGYPEAYPKGSPIELTWPAPGSALARGSEVYHAGTKMAGGKLVTSGGRVLAVTGTGPTLKKALGLAYARLDGGVKFQGLHRRQDIGYRALPPHRHVRIGVLGSTKGTDLAAILASVAPGSGGALASAGGVSVRVVVSNKASSGILDKARQAGVEAVHLPCAKGEDREAYDAKVTAVLEAHAVDLVLCVGWMRILSPAFCSTWAGRCLNVHPSLLPLFAGGMDGDVHEAVLKSKATESGCTVHQVTAEVDGGQHAVVKKCGVLLGETPESLKAKVQTLEGEALIEAVLLFKQGALPGQEGASGAAKEVITYAAAGVDIAAGNALVERIKPACKSTRRPGCDADLGGFGGLFDLSAAGFAGDDVVLVGATDGVGTKLKVAMAANIHRYVGIDLVAMCVNDLIVAGAEPLFFLDYFATGKLSVEATASIVEGIAEGCRQSGCGLIGGETAEMPSMYAPGEYDLGGFSVGAVRRAKIMPSPDFSVASGDVLLALSSSGVHSNGFSLVRKLVDRAGLSYQTPAPWIDGPNAASVGESLLTPTKIYVKALLPLLNRGGVLKAMAHITGGGLPENIPRVLPKDLAAQVDLAALKLPPVFQWLRAESGLAPWELTKTFNCGVGMVLVVPPAKVAECLQLLEAQGETAFQIGSIVPRAEGGEQVVLNGELA